MTVIEKQYMDSVISINRMMRKAQDAEPDWEQRRYETSKDLMVAIMNNPDIATGVKLNPSSVEDLPVTLAKLSLTFADALLDELKKSPKK
ncbi:MAG: hypothetical protein K2L96_00020 [Muribaculaceae bacterium]|nr:hypothetical protein [Muribaculaceae bacterium]